MGPERATNGLQDPLGRRGTNSTAGSSEQTFKAMFGKGEGSEGVDDTFAHRWMDGSVPSSLADISVLCVGIARRQLEGLVGRQSGL